MKSVQTIVSSAILLTAVAAGSALFAHAQSHGKQSGVQRVTITAKRMSADEKLAYDMEQVSGVQTVVISAKRPVKVAQQRKAFQNETAI